VQGSDERWVSLAADQLGESEDVIRGYLERGNDNVLLANLTYITRQIFHSLEDNRDMAASSASILPSLSSKFDVRNTLPELQSRFSALWDEIEQAPNDPVRTEICDTLLNLRNALIQGTDDAATVPSASKMTNLSGNPSDSFSPIHEKAEKSAQTHTITPPPVSHHSATLATSPPWFLLSASDHITVVPADESSTASSRPIPLGSHDQSGTSRAIASTATSVTDDTVSNQSGEQPTVRPNSGSVLPAMVTTPSSISTTPEVAPVFRSHVTGTQPFVAHHDAPDLGDPIEFESPHCTRQSAASEHIDRSDNST
jgi:hypothetical protein